MEIRTARTEPPMDMVPLIPHIRGTACSCSFRCNALRPKGKGMPMKKPSGKSKAKASRILELREGTPERREVTSSPYTAADSTATRKRGRYRRLKQKLLHCPA